jgi:hypothetical protein
MYNIAVMTEFDGDQGLPNESPGDVFIEMFLLQDSIMQLPAGEILHDDIAGVFFLVEIDQMNDIRMLIDFLHDFDFVP